MHINKYRSHITTTKKSDLICIMISNEIKRATQVAHQQLEKVVILEMKNIRSEADYAQVLKKFYAYFQAVERAIAPYVTPALMPHYSERRNSLYIKQDIETLGAHTDDTLHAIAPSINSPIEALGALYVLEGSIMGGPYIVQMLKKYGMKNGFSFFSGYGENTEKMWNSFIDVLNNIAHTEVEKTILIRAAEQTFENFGLVFQTSIDIQSAHYEK